MKEFRLRKGWVAIVEEGPDGANITIKYPQMMGDKVGVGEAFFAVTTDGNPYGAPKVMQEPTLGVPLRECGVVHDGRVVGAVVVSDDGKVKSRVSWTNLVVMKKQTFRISGDGELFINDEPQGYLWLVFTPDKNRMEGFVGVFRPTPPTKPVRVCELEDLAVEAVLAL